ncbi:MAG: hypothetical protein JWP89_2722 [Schlesneria sp.]|nr:hypothetical protein [Schlesneria sp.]
MAGLGIKFDLPDTDYSMLVTEADIAAEAKRLLPTAVKQYANAMAEELWDKIKAIATTQRSAFVREKTAEIEKLREAQKDVESHLISELRKGKAKAAGGSAN